jgi:hypothetical protein
MNEMLKQSLPAKGNRAVVGGVAGSYPIWGAYQPLRFISWGCKFLADALMLEQRLAHVVEASFEANSEKDSQAESQANSYERPQAKPEPSECA